ncbi:hypothetical protein SAMN02982917_6495 [Azospirillum oryzae]|uniref:Uncharacterized protein n=1 Tax=Azospirillum oryzae TaxID=286727 RepID=A0A1X7HN51_9PROT|nr:hypothetical protein SAMN02982917_6495 [Azospirillum oryzae]
MRWRPGTSDTHIPSYRPWYKLFLLSHFPQVCHWWSGHRRNGGGQGTWWNHRMVGRGRGILSDAGSGFVKLRPAETRLRERPLSLWLISGCRFELSSGSDNRGTGPLVRNAPMGSIPTLSRRLGRFSGPSGRHQEGRDRSREIDCQLPVPCRWADCFSPMTMGIAQLVADAGQAVHHALAVAEDGLEHLFDMLVRGKSRQPNARSVASTRRSPTGRGAGTSPPMPPAVRPPP